MTARLHRLETTTLALVPPALAAMGAVHGFRTEYLMVAVLYAVLLPLGAGPRRFAIAILPLVAAGVLYDNFALLSYLRGHIHVAALHNADLIVFGIPAGAGGARVTPGDWLAAHTDPVLDLLCGLADLTYMLEVFAAAGYWFFRDLSRMQRLAWGFFFVNLLGIVIRIVFPAAPPWYVARFGFGPIHPGVQASAAGAARFDMLLGVDWFQTFYAHSTNIFGAMPSLHVAYPTLVALLARGRAKGLAWAFVTLVAFSAVYLHHHYLLDVFAGVGCALLVHLVLSAAWRWRERRRGVGLETMPAAEGAR